MQNIHRIKSMTNLYFIAILPIIFETIIYFPYIQLLVFDI